MSEKLPWFRADETLAVRALLAAYQWSSTHAVLGVDLPPCALRAVARGEAHTLDRLTLLALRARLVALSLDGYAHWDREDGLEQLGANVVGLLARARRRGEHRAAGEDPRALPSWETEKWGAEPILDLRAIVERVELDHGEDEASRAVLYELQHSLDEGQERRRAREERPGHDDREVAPKPARDATVVLIALRPELPVEQALVKKRGASMFGDLARVAREVREAHEGARWPSSRWASDPVGFATTILGVALWSFQVEFLEAIRDHRHVAAAAGRKCGKDFVAAVACLWWFCSFKTARVFLLAPTSKQLDRIVWREIRMLHAGSGRCLECKRANPAGPRPCEHSAIIPGSPGLSAQNGLSAPDFREIFGATAVGDGGMRGFSGARVLLIEDEAADVRDDIDAACVGNIAGADCHRAMMSNPVKDHGFFHRAFHVEREMYKLIQASTEDSPNVVAGEDLFPGLASRQWVRERESAWGRGSALFAANVEGKFPTASQGQLFPLSVITEASATERYAAAEAVGRLQLGIDVAGEGKEGDEIAFCVRRGWRQLEPILAIRGMTPDGIRDMAFHILARHRAPADESDDTKPIICLDRDGGTGARVFDAFDAYRKRDAVTRSEFHLIGFQGGQAPKGPLGVSYRWTRDAGFAGLVQWIAGGGAILPDLKLEAEMSALRWKSIEGGRSELERKSEIVDRLGRSPDRLDSLMLSVYLPPGSTFPRWWPRARSQTRAHTRARAATTRTIKDSGATAARGTGLRDHHVAADAAAGTARDAPPA